MDHKWENAEVLHRYGDIIDRQRPRTGKRTRMPMTDRAAQFSPFAALTGHGAAIQETARLTEADVELAEDARIQLDRRLDLLLWLQQTQPESEQPQVTVTFFEPDEKKAGGAYLDRTGALRRVDAHRRLLFLSDSACIALDRVIAIEGEIFSRVER